MSNAQVALNDYQQLMLRLSKLSPYNAVHAVAIEDKHADLSVWNQSINKVIQQLGIGRPEFSSSYQQVTYHPLSEPLQLERRSIALETHVECEMNYHFAINEFPLRFFIIDDQSQLYFSISYHHWIGDAYAIYRLIEWILTDCKNTTPHHLALETVNIEDCFKQIYQNKTMLYRYFGLLRGFFQFSRGFRTIARDEQCLTSSCDFYFFDKEVTAKLLETCKIHDLTVNDFCVTLLAQLFGDVSQDERKNLKKKWFKPKRDRIIIAIISNIRRHSLQPLNHILSVFLGFFYISFKSPEVLSFQALSKIVRSKTQQAKQSHAAIKQYLLFNVQNKMWDRRTHKRSQYRIFNKNTPITVGISNMNLTQNDTLPLQNAHHYIRFSPTAMICPIVFNITTFSGCLSLGINYRKACYTSEQVTQIKNKFIMALNQL